MITNHTTRAFHRYIPFVLILLIPLLTSCDPKPYVDHDALTKATVSNTFRSIQADDADSITFNSYNKYVHLKNVPVSVDSSSSTVTATGEIIASNDHSYFSYDLYFEGFESIIPPEEDIENLFADGRHIGDITTIARLKQPYDTIWQTIIEDLLSAYRIPDIAGASAEEILSITRTFSTPYAVEITADSVNVYNNGYYTESYVDLVTDIEADSQTIRIESRTEKSESGDVITTVNLLTVNSSEKATSLLDDATIENISRYVKSLYSL